VEAKLLVNSGWVSIFFFIGVDWRRFDGGWCPLDDVASAGTFDQWGL
jgi:hypothetical protein